MNDPLLNTITSMDFLLCMSFEESKSHDYRYVYQSENTIVHLQDIFGELGCKDHLYNLYMNNLCLYFRGTTICLDSLVDFSPKRI